MISVCKMNMTILMGKYIAKHLRKMPNELIEYSKNMRIFNVCCFEFLEGPAENVEQTIIQNAIKH